MKFIKRIRVWKKWRKTNGRTEFYNLKVLLGIRHSDTFDIYQQKHNGSVCDVCLNRHILSNFSPCYSCCRMDARKSSDNFTDEKIFSHYKRRYESN